MSLTVWAWLTVAVILLAGEVLSPGMLMLPFGVGALAAAITSAISTNTAWPWIAFIVVSSALMIGLQRWLARRRGR